MGHGVVGPLVTQQLGRQGEDLLLLRAGQLDRARLDGLGPLGLPPEDKHRPPQGGGLLLEPAGVGHHQIGPGHEVVHLVGGQGVDEVDAGVAGQVLPRRLPHHRGQVDGVDQLHVGEGVGNAAQGGHDVGHGLAVVLPPVAGHQDDPLPRVVQAVEGLGGKLVVRPHGGFQGVDDGVARDEHPVGDALPGQVLPVGGGGAKVEIGDIPHQLAVHLLREGGVLVPGAQAGLHMAHRDLAVEGRQGPGEGGGGVPVNQHQVGPGLLQHPLHAQQALGGDGGQGLPGLHDVEIVIGRQAENLQHRIQHFPVLGGDAADGLDVRPLLQLQHQGGHLDGLRPGAEDGHDTDGLHGSSPSFSPPSSGLFFLSLPLPPMKIRAEMAPAKHRASSSSMAFTGPLVVSTTADRPRMALTT